MTRWTQALVVWVGLVGCSDPRVTGDGGLTGPTECVGAACADAGVTVGIGRPSIERARFTAVAATPRALFVSTGTAVFRSLDAGESWTLLREPALHDVRAMLARGSEVFVLTEHTVHHSGDEGETWRDTQLRNPYGGVEDTSDLTARGSEVYLATLDRVHRWDSGAWRWDPLPSTTAQLGHETITVLPEVIESDGSSIFATRRSRGGVFRLDLAAPDAGWTHVDSLDQWGYLAYAFAGGIGVTSGSRGIARREGSGSWARTGVELGAVTDLLVDGEALYAAGGEGVHESLDGGLTWTRVLGEPCDSRFALASDGTHVFAITAEGLVRRRDGVWEAVDLRANEIWRLASAGDALLSISAGGFQRRAGDGWEALADRPDDGSPIVLHDGEVFVLKPFGIVASADGGRSFAPRAAPWAGGRLALLASTPWGLVGQVQYIGGADLEISTDGARTWTRVSRTPGSYEHGLYELGGDLFLAGSGVVHRSRDRGQTWESFRLGTDAPIRALVAIDGALFAAAGTLHRSSDGGASWQELAFQHGNVSSLLVHEGRLFAGVGSTASFDGGVYSSRDLGESWATVDPAFTARVSALAMHEGALFAGTLDQSTWALSLAPPSE